MTKQIELTHDRFALVDDEDYDELNQYKWCVQKGCKTFYARRRTHNGKRATVMMHREIQGLVPSDDKECDHINQNGLDNRRENLRIVSHKVNGRNRGKSINNSSGFNGVTWHKSCNKWHAYIMVDCKQIHLGLYDEIEDAVEARRQAETKYWKEVSV